MERFYKAIKSTFLPIDRKFAARVLQGFSLSIVLFTPIEIRTRFPWLLFAAGVIAIQLLLYYIKPQLFKCDKTCAYFIGLLLAGCVLCVLESALHIDRQSFGTNSAAVLLIAAIGICLTFAYNLWRTFRSE